jgi:MraZ protein
MIFKGSFVVDNRMGKISIPSEFINLIVDNQVYIRKHHKKDCLVVYLKEDWQNLLIDIRKKINPFSREHNTFLKQFVREIFECELKNNYLSLPKDLINLFDAENSKLRIIGADNCFEIWKVLDA